MESVVTFQGVSKQFKGKLAVYDISFSIKEGETVAILGPNGAGKTTTMMMMLGLLKSSKGKIELFHNESFSKEVKDRLGVMLQDVSVIDALKVHEILKLFRSYYSNPLTYEKLIHLTGFDKELLNRMAHKLSGGQKRRLSFALALAGNPDILFLDEPTVGMDITSRKQFWENIQKLKESGKTIIFTTHYLQEADDIADRILLFSKGSIIADGSPQSIKQKLSQKSLSFNMNETIPIEQLRKNEMIIDLYEKNNRVYIVTDYIDEVLALLFDMRLSLKGIAIEEGRLEEAFELLTTQGEIKQYE